MELACELVLLYIQGMGDIRACAQGLNDTQVLVCVLERRDSWELAYELGLEQHIPHKKHQQHNRYNDQQYI